MSKGADSGSPLVFLRLGSAGTCQFARGGALTYNPIVTLGNGTEERDRCASVSGHGARVLAVGVQVWIPISMFCAHPISV